jgi:hypothetical protein
MKEEKLYKTTDLWLTSFLITHGAKLIKFETDHIKPDKIIFCLSDNQNVLEEVANNYYLGATVPALNFKDIVLNLKHQMYRHTWAKNEGEYINGKRIRSLG